MNYIKLILATFLVCMPLAAANTYNADQYKDEHFSWKIAHFLTGYTTSLLNPTPQLTKDAFTVDYSKGPRVYSKGCDYAFGIGSILGLATFYIGGSLALYKTIQFFKHNKITIAQRN